MEDHFEQIERQIATASSNDLFTLAADLERRADAVPMDRYTRSGIEHRAKLLFLAGKARREIALR